MYKIVLMIKNAELNNFTLSESIVRSSKIKEYLIMKYETIDRIRKFTEDRNWDQFHSPANLAKSIVIEAAELLECFQLVQNQKLRVMQNSVGNTEALLHAEGILTEQLFVLVGQSHNFQRILDSIGLGCPS